MKRVLLAASLFMGCASTPEVPEKKAPPAPSLTGRFANDGCITQENADGTTSWVKLGAELTPTTWAMDVIVFGDEQCATRNATVHHEGTYTVGSPSAKVPGAFDLELVPTKRTITPHVPGYVALLQSYSCGKAPYAVNEPQDVLAAGCKDLGYHPATTCPKEHDIVKVDADRITLGKRPPDGDLCTPEKRPAELSPVSFQRAP